MRPLSLSLLAIFAAAVTLPAQDRHSPNFRFDFTGGAGRARHETESSPFDGYTDGGFARFRFEGVSNAGFGGGIQLETWGSDDDLFVDEGFQAQESQAGSIFGHFTYRIDRGRFRMPIRVGVMAHNYELESVTTPSLKTLEVDTIATRFEVAPEVVFVRNPQVEFAGYGEFGMAGGYSSAEIATSSSDFDSVSAFWYAEIGARVRWKFLEFGTGFLTHGMAMAESDNVGTTVINGFGSSFSGIIFTGAFVF